jgi:hypothetical protein
MRLARQGADGVGRTAWGAGEGAVVTGPEVEKAGSGPEDRGWNRRGRGQERRRKPRNGGYQGGFPARGSAP